MHYIHSRRPAVIAGRVGLHVNQRKLGVDHFWRQKNSGAAFLRFLFSVVFSEKSVAAEWKERILIPLLVSISASIAQLYYEADWIYCMKCLLNNIVL